MTAGERDDGLVGGFVPLHGRVGFCAKFSTGHQGVQDAHPVKVKAVLIGGEVLEKRLHGFTGGQGPKFFLPRGHLATDFGVGSERVLEARANMTSIDAGNPSGIGVFRGLGQGLGKEGLGRIRWGRGSRLHRLLESPTKDGQNGEGAVGEKEVAECLQPDNHEFDGVFPLEASGLASQGKRAVGGDFGKKVRVGFHPAERGLKSGGETGQFTGTTVAHPEDDHSGWKPIPIPPVGVSLGIEIEIHPKIDMRNNRTPKILGTRSGRFYLFEGPAKVG